MSDSSVVLYRPGDAWVGDAIPFFARGSFWVFYLHERRERPPSGTSWYLLRSEDGVTFEDLGEVLPHGSRDEQDWNAYTGSVIEHEGRFHLFYTGYNDRLLDPVTRQPLQAVMHAVSDDLLSWFKEPDDTFYADPVLYESNDWRDPFVIWDPEPGRFVMLLASRGRSGPDRRRGCIALASSTNLAKWDIERPFWAPSRWITHECPEVFRMGDWWYLVFSEFSETFTTRYRMSRSMYGPWQVPARDSLDSRAFYAAKTASDGARRFAYGWIASKEDDRDDGAWQWAGDLAVHELVQQPDGTLAVRMPEGIRQRFGERIAFSLQESMGAWEVGGDRVSASAPDAYASVFTSPLPDQYLLRATLTFEPGTREAGVILRADPESEDGYILRLEPGRRRVVWDRWPRRIPGEHQWMVDGDVPHAVELERPHPLRPGERHTLELLVDGTVCIAYLDGITALSARMYDRPGRSLGLFVGEGTAVLDEITISGRRPITTQEEDKQ